MNLRRRLFACRAGRWSLGWLRWPHRGRAVYRGLALGPLELRVYRSWPDWVLELAEARRAACPRCLWVAGVLRALASALESAQGRRP